MISVVIASVNDPSLGATLQSIRDTSGDINLEIVCVDDCSPTPVSKTCPKIGLANKVIRNQSRMGCGPSRTIGARHASGTHVLFIDSHSKFEPGWLQHALGYLTMKDGSPSNEKVLWCGICLQPKDWSAPLSSAPECYHGATWNFYGPDPNDGSKTQVLEPNWLKARPADGAEIPCVLGACYFINREWFLHLNPLEHLRIIGSDETMLSMAAWLTGGEVRFMGSVRIGHKHEDSKQQQRRFTTMRGLPTYNKLFAINCLFPNQLRDILYRKLRAITPGSEWHKATEMVKCDGGTFQSERNRFQSLFTRDVRWLAAKFNIPLPQ